MRVVSEEDGGGCDDGCALFGYHLFGTTSVMLIYGAALGTWVILGRSVGRHYRGTCWAVSASYQKNLVVASVELS
jgi:hypothetical protein